MKEHTSDASIPWLRLPAQCPVLFGSVETLCELETLGHSEENIRSLDLCQSAGGMAGVQVLCWRAALGCRQHALGAGSSRAQASCLQHLIFLLGPAGSCLQHLIFLWGPAGSRCNASLQDLLGDFSAECLGATGKVPMCLWLRKTVSHASLARKQPLGNCPHNHTAAQSACRTPPLPTATADLPEPAASEGLAP